MKQISTKLRLLSYLFLYGTVIGSYVFTGLIIASLIDKKLYDSQQKVGLRIALVGIVVMNVMLTRALLRFASAHFDFRQRMAFVRYPFRFKTIALRFDELAGFYLTERWGRGIVFKVLVLRTLAGKEYSMTDLEVRNMNAVHAAIWPWFPLLDKKSKAPLSPAEKEHYLLNDDQKFNFLQAGTISDTAWMLLILLLVIIAMDVFWPHPDRRLLTPVGSTIMLAVAIFAACKWLLARNMKRRAREDAGSILQRFQKQE